MPKLITSVLSLITLKDYINFKVWKELTGLIRTVERILQTYRVVPMVQPTRFPFKHHRLGVVQADSLR